MQFDHELEDLIYRYLESIIAGSAQEALLQDIVQIAIVQTNQLFEVINLSKLSLELLPLALDHRDHDIFIECPQEVLHLLPEELKFAKLTKLACRDSPEFSTVQVLPDERKAMTDTLQLQQEEE